MLTITTTVLSRILAVHSAAADRSRTSAILSGVSLRTEPGTIIIAATDGKLLIEERWEAEADAEPLDVVLALDAMRPLALWLKMARASWKASQAVAITTDERGNVTFAKAGESAGCVCRRVEGTFPPYAHCLPGPAATSSFPSRIGYRLEYWAALSKAWDGAAVSVENHRGSIVRLLQPTLGCKSAVAILMPITLSD